MNSVTYDSISFLNKAINGEQKGNNSNFIDNITIEIDERMDKLL
jgi:hypothetical protein